MTVFQLAISQAQDSWTAVNGAPQVANSLTADSGSNYVECDCSTAEWAKRVVTAVTDDNTIVYFAHAADTVSGSAKPGRTEFYDGATRVCIVRSNKPSDTDIDLRDGGSWMTAHTGAITSANTWYTIGVEFDFTNERYRCNVDGGTMSAWASFENSTSQIDSIQFYASGTTSQKYFWDTLTGSGGGGGGGYTGSIGSVAGIAQADIASIAGVANADVASIGGVSNS